VSDTGPMEAARAFIERYFPECAAAFLAGSVVRGEGTATSDLDIVVITGREEVPFRQSFVESGWPIEVFVHNEESLRRYFASDVEDFTPSLPVMCTEGIVLRDVDGLAQRIRQGAEELLERGPEPLTPEQIEARRYFLTDLLDDLTGSQKHDEAMFIANNLAVKAAELLLLHNRQWIGHGKWLPRALKRFDPEVASQLTSALDTFYRTGDKDELIRFAEGALALAGGRLFEGYYSSGKRDEPPAE
jgi:predicted nucleotidyltransferase